MILAGACDFSHLAVKFARMPLAFLPSFQHFFFEVAKSPFNYSISLCYLKCIKVLPSFKELVSKRAKRDIIRSIKRKYDDTLEVNLVAWTLHYIMWAEKSANRF